MKRLITDYFAVSTLSPSTSSPPDLKSNVATKRNTSRGKQLFLDLGQSLHKECVECGMRYSESFPEDVKLHKRFHRQKLLEQNTKPSKKNLGPLIIKIGQYFVYKLKNIAILKEKFDEELSRDVFVMVDNELVLKAFISVEPIDKAFPVGMDSKNNLVAASLGVRYIWIQEELRRQSYGTKLLATALYLQPQREHTVFAFNAKHITGDAWAFAKRFFPKEVLAYTLPMKHPIK